MKIENMMFPSGFDDVLILGDIHGNLDAFTKSIEFADENNLFILSLGDIVDYGVQSFETFMIAYDLIKSNKMKMVMGNHENKIMRHFMGNNVILNDSHLVTINGFKNGGDPTGSTFLEIMNDTPHIITMDDTVFVHAGVHKRFWQDETNSKMRKAITATAMYGQIDNDNPGPIEGYPNRVYYWQNNIPTNKTVFIGHDVYDTVQHEVNEDGGTVWKMDTGSSKGGYLSGMVLGSNEIIQF